MCSIFKYGNVIGRNFDYEQSYDEEIRIVEQGETHRDNTNNYKIIGVCSGFVDDYPLFYDAMNDKGLFMGGLAFAGNAKYNPVVEDKHNIPSYAFILEVLGNFSRVSDVKSFLADVNITDEAFSEVMPPSDLHWFIADKDESIIVEQTKDGLHYYEGSVMTNNPPYPLQQKLCEAGIDRIGENVPKSYTGGVSDTRGSETYELSGDYTSMGRFTRLTYLKHNLETHENTFNPVSQSFHLLGSIEQLYGSTPVGEDYEYTIYSIVYDLAEGKTYLKFYDECNVQEYTI